MTHTNLAYFHFERKDKMSCCASFKEPDNKCKEIYRNRSKCLFILSDSEICHLSLIVFNFTYFVLYSKRLSVPNCAQQAD